MSIELRNIAGNCADIYESETNTFLLSWNFASPPKSIVNTFDSVHAIVPVQILVKLKEAGFSADEIVTMNKEFIIE